MEAQRLKHPPDIQHRQPLHLLTHLLPDPDKWVHPRLAFDSAIMCSPLLQTFVRRLSNWSLLHIDNSPNTSKGAKSIFWEAPNKRFQTLFPYLVPFWDHNKIENTLMQRNSLRHGLRNKLFAYWAIASNPIKALYAENLSIFVTDCLKTRSVSGKKNFRSCCTILRNSLKSSKMHSK